MTGVLLKVINVFCSENLALFMVTSIYRIRKSTKRRNSKTGWNPKWKATENSKLKQVKRHRNRINK